MPWADRFSIGLSALCILHCLLMPLLLVALPNLGKSLIDSETLHLCLVYAVIPLSLFALGVGCTQHRRGLFIALGVFGLGFLVLGVAVEAMGLRHLWEQLFTVLGALFIAFAHLHNFRQCRTSRACACE